MTQRVKTLNRIFNNQKEKRSYSYGIGTFSVETDYKNSNLTIWQIASIALNKFFSQWNESVYMNVMHKVPIGTICKLSCKNLISEFCTANPWTVHVLVHTRSDVAMCTLIERRPSWSLLRWMENLCFYKGWEQCTKKEPGKGNKVVFALSQSSDKFCFVGLFVCFSFTVHWYIKRGKWKKTVIS